VVVVGAGPAGIEAAVAAAQRGHAVTLLEQAAAPGGALRDILRDPLRASWRPLLDRLERDLAKAEAAAAVTVHCGEHANADTVLALTPDAVLVATGSKPLPPQFPTDNSVALIDSRALWRDGWPASRQKKIVVVAGQDRHIEPLLVALHAAQIAEEVVLVTEDMAPGLDLERRALNELVQRLRLAGIAQRCVATVSSVERGSVQVIDLATGAVETLVDVQLIIMAHGRSAADELLAQLDGRVAAYAIGDALAPRRFTHAILEGARFGASL
jgi:NADPH-dependent 2,4-dienoyl-CoA reductase/sulfur reductase-like enzyme